MYWKWDCKQSFPRLCFFPNRLLLSSVCWSKARLCIYILFWRRVIFRKIFLFGTEMEAKILANRLNYCGGIWWKMFVEIQNERLLSVTASGKTNSTVGQFLTALSLFFWYRAAWRKITLSDTQLFEGCFI